jgi:hypothetical protein
MYQTSSWNKPSLLSHRWPATEEGKEHLAHFRRLWYTLSYKFSAQQGWRHGVRSRSLGGIYCRQLPQPGRQ